MQKKHSFPVRLRAFKIWQKLGYLPWRKPAKEIQVKESGDFYKGAFDGIPFLNQDAKRTFTHLLLRPGYMIRDYISGQHDKYLSPLTALIIFYAFFGLISSVLQPIQHEKKDRWGDIVDKIEVAEEFREEGQEPDRLTTIVVNTIYLLRTGYIYMNLDQYPDEVDTQHESAIAALERTLRNQGIPLVLSQFFFLWFAMALALRRYKKGMPAYAAASAYILCQFSFFMLFAVLLTFGESTSLGVLLMGLLLMIDFREWLSVSWKQSFKLTVLLGIWYALLFGVVLVLVAGVVVLIAWLQGA